MKTLEQGRLDFTQDLRDQALNIVEPKDINKIFGKPHIFKSYFTPNKNFVIPEHLYSKTQLLFNAIYHDVIDIGEEISINELTSLNLPLAVFKEDYFELLFANNILEVRNRNRFFEFVKCYINHYGIYYKDIKCATSLKIKGYLENTHLKNRHKYGIRSMSGMLAHSSLFNGVLPDKEDQKEYGIYRLWSIR